MVIEITNGPHSWYSCCTKIANANVCRWRRRKSLPCWGWMEVDNLTKPAWGLKELLCNLLTCLNLKLCLPISIRIYARCFALSTSSTIWNELGQQVKRWSAHYTLSYKCSSLIDAHDLWTAHFIQAIKVYCSLSKGQASWALEQAWGWHLRCLEDHPFREGSLLTHEYSRSSVFCVTRSLQVHSSHEE